ncbi:hypothetical protein CALCODRAFT_484900 [Calocera cornea HHB12733]|uniref:Uncharacterized protein n=1 Tax=Calocera cornea HHB12733 TaxID=1353952 RepID=A0A165ENT3_9BASI|nr:hypothetical protein CALCODRAFT_484900 [Calocera cornea HHB12733]
MFGSDPDSENVPEGSIDIRDVFSTDTPRPAPLEQEYAEGSRRIGDKGVKLPKNASAAYALVPERLRPIFIMENKSWRRHIRWLASPENPEPLTNPEVILVLCAFLMNVQSHPRAMRVLAEVAEARPGCLKDLLTLDTIETLLHAAERGAAYNFMATLIALMFRLYFPSHAQHWPVVQFRDAHLLPKIDLDAWIGHSTISTAPSSAGEADQVLSGSEKHEPIQSLSETQMAVVSRICRFMLDILYERHHYTELIQFHEDMCRCGIPSSEKSYGRVLSAHFRWFLYPDVFVQPDKIVTFPMFMKRIQATMEDMSRAGIYANSLTRSTLLTGFTRCLIRSHPRDLRERWAVIGPPLMRLRSSAHGSTMLRVQWTEVLLEWEEARMRRFRFQKYRLGVEPDPPSEMETTLMKWFSETFKAVQESLRVTGRNPSSWEQLTLIQVDNEIKICALNMRAALMQGDTEFDTAVYWLQQLKSGYEHGMKRLQLFENHYSTSLQRDMDARFESSMMRFVSWAIDRGRLDHVLGALSFSGYMKNTYQFLGLWHRVFPLVARKNYGWDDPRGPRKALQTLVGAVDAHRAFGVIHRKTGPDHRIGNVFRNTKDHNVYAYLIWTAIVGSASHQSLLTAIRYPDSDAPARVKFLRDVFKRLAVDPPDKIWSLQSSNLVDLCRIKGEELEQADLDRAQWLFNFEPIFDPNDDGTFRFFGVKFNRNNR